MTEEQLFERLTDVFENAGPEICTFGVALLNRERRRVGIDRSHAAAAVGRAMLVNAVAAIACATTDLDNDEIDDVYRETLEFLVQQLAVAAA